MADLIRLENLRKGKMFRVWDIPIFAILLALTAALLLVVFMQGEGDNVEVYVDGVLYEVLPLDADSTTTITSADGTYSLVLNIKNGEAYVTHATCDDKICQYSNRISKVHSQIICSPARIVIKVVGEADYDGVIGGSVEIW